MRTFISVKKGPVGVEPHLVMTCNCGIEKPLVEFVPQGARPPYIKSINLLRLMQWAGEFAMEHASCPDQPPAPKPDDDIPF